MATVTIETKTKTPAEATVSATTTISRLPELPQRFADLKKEIIAPENEEKVKASYKRLLAALKEKADEIHEAGSSYVPQVKWADIKANGMKLPEDVLAQFEERGCIIVKEVVQKSQAEKWWESLHKFVTDHPELSGYPLPNPTNWFAYWTESQVQARSHPDVMECLKVMSQVWHASPDSPVDTDSQTVYADRFRIRYPGKEVSLMLHLDSGAIERWEDPQYRSVYRKIFEGNWEEYDPYSLDERPYAKTDLYSGLKGRPSACSCFRSLQGWLSLSDTKEGEGTIRFLPNVKLATAYMMLKPFFWQENGSMDFETSRFPGATPGSGQYFPNKKWYPHLEHEKTVVGIPNVEPGDYVFWHCDLPHEVDKQHAGTTHSSVFYNAQVPLCPYNIESMIKQRKAFEQAIPPPDFEPNSVTNAQRAGIELHYERDFEDHGAKMENILSDDGLRAMGFKYFDVNEPGITIGQKKIRQMANEALEKEFGPLL